MKWVVTMVVLLSLAGPIAALEETQTQTPGMLLQQAIYAERTEGDLDKAIGIYEKVVMASKESRRILALAVFRLGSCHAKKGQPDLAQMHFERIVEEFSEYATLVNRASRELDRLKPKEPAPAMNKTVLLFDSLEQGKASPDGWDKQGDVPGVKYIWDKQVASMVENVSSKLFQSRPVHFRSDHSHTLRCLPNPAACRTQPRLH